MMRNRLRLLASPLLLAALALLAGCSRGDHEVAGDETAEPDYRRGQQLEKQGRPQEALAAYLKVIALRGEDAAPESHLEVGVINLQHVKDPLEAIYHFKKYLQLQPNSRQAGLVRQQIDAATRDFARTLLAQPLENASDRGRLQDQVAALQRENDQLKAELAGYRGAPSPAHAEPMILAPQGQIRAPSPPPADSAVMLVPQGPAAAPRPAPAPTGTAKAPARPPASPTKGAPSSATRKYAVQPKDTLFKIAQRYPGTGSTAARAQAIFDANRDVMKSATDLRPGMELRIP
ncbi:MAG TPA: LysM peptidoglycan-binding domain-containing protein [Opitutaceae bacterium]|nr:LysM peptidoglycan-binding domain-containing protein [Opitutaceae bacterium]